MIYEHFGVWAWTLAIVGAFLVGFSKMGLGGVGMLFVVLFAQIMPAKQATGIVLPLLCFGDLVAVTSYRQHAQWQQLWRLFPWAAIGVIVGYFAMSRIDEHQTRVLLGGIVLALIALHLIRRSSKKAKETTEGGEAQPVWFPPLVGILAGFTTLIANASGPLMAIYLLSMRLPKLEYVGTTAMFFFILNLYKVPFMVSLGLINSGSFTFNLMLAPVVLAGALVGRKVVAKLNQRWFENTALGLSAVAGAKLLF